MARDLFSQSLSAPAAPRRSRLTIVGSFLVHGAAIVLLVVVPLGAALDPPTLASRLTLAVLADPPIPPKPPVPRPPEVPRAQQTTSAAAPVAPSFPTDEPSSLGPEPPAPPSFSGVGLRTPIGSGIPGGITGDRTITLSPPPPMRQDPVRVGGDIRAPQRIGYVAPRYPPLAQSARLEGDVTIEALINERGEVIDAKVVKGTALLDAAALEAVRQWRYLPTRLNGMPVSVLLQVTVRFQLR